MKFGILNLVKKIHHNLPPELRNSYRFVLVFIRKLGYSLMPVRHFFIKEGDCDELFSFVYIGWDKKLCSYWLNRISSNCEIISESGKIASWNIPGFLKRNKNKVDIVIVESDKNAPPGRYPSSFLLPRWMEMNLDIEMSLKKSRINNIKRNIKKYSLKYEIREGSEAFDLFYHKMYKPYLIKRHGESADISDYRHFSRKYHIEKCKLFFIISKNEPVAAAFIETKKNGYRLSAFGILDGSTEIFKMGVIGALYYFVMLHYYEKGFRSLLIGSSMAVVFDGVTEFKMQIGGEPYLEDLPGRQKYYFLPMNTRPRTARILKTNPLFYLTKGGLNIATFISSVDFSNKADFLKFFKRLKSEKAEKTNMFFLDDDEKIVNWINEEGVKDVEISRYK
ncbi:MAG: hypothetical protein ACFCUM_08205 [Bacteroidales bacterium]